MLSNRLIGFNNSSKDVEEEVRTLGESIDLAGTPELLSLSSLTMKALGPSSPHEVMQDASDRVPMGHSQSILTKTNQKKRKELLRKGNIK